jgi:hypothetical protein
MAYTPPTAAEVKARFPEFSAVADATVDAVLAEAGSFVDDSWIEADYKPAVMFYTAHELLMAGQGTSAAAKISQIGDFGRIKSGDLEFSRQQGAAAAGDSADGTFGLTKYGKKFLELRSRSFPSVRMF